MMKLRCFLLAIAVFLLSLHQSSSSYDPPDKIFISCGSTDDSTIKGLHWVSDSNPKYAPIKHQNSLATKAVDQPSSVAPVPYTTARISRSNLSYSFPVTQGPKFVRLYFFSSNYDQNFSRPDAVFSVTSGSYTLLRNFSVSLVADSLDKYNLGTGSRSFFKEFFVVVQDNQRLNLTFSPSTDGPNSYALINGIEIVSMPSDLYYSNQTEDGSREIDLISSSNRITLSYTNAMETMHRVNMGGDWIDPEDDTGMFRSWAAPDDPYVTEDLNSTLPVDLTTPLTYTNIPEYAAPENVYRTGRSMGPHRTINRSYNLTWSFPVDSNFYYLVRLHFCELQDEITARDERAFEIFIASFVANGHADIIRWSGGRAHPIYKDFVVYMLDPVIRKTNLTVSLHTLPDSDTVYADALLNGVEIFKISSSGDNNLAGPNPDPIPVESPEGQPSSGKSCSGISKKVIIAIAGASAFSALVLGLLCLLYFRRGKTSKEPSDADKTSFWAPLSYTTTKSTTTTGSSLPADLCRHFSLPEIMAATNGFDEVFIVGIGGFGNVYKGYVDGGSTPVAIKRLNPGSQQGAREFMTEIEMLSQLRHQHLVSLIGYCNEGGEMILVYDYMSRGTLREHLYNTENAPLPWKQRLEICIGAARGLHYLHTGTKNVIIHRDMKTTNILLDDKWVAKVSDFGLSKIGPTNMPNSKDHVTTVVKGTFGYLDPEYLRRQQLTDKSDVYSFGVVLFEVLCARPPVNRTMEKKQISLAAWAQSCYKNGELNKIIDTNLRGKIAPECQKKFSEIAMSCLREEGSQRPSMNDVVWGLEFALQLQESADERMKPEAIGMMGGTIDEEEVPLAWKSSDSETDHTGNLISSSGEKLMTSTSNSTSTDSGNFTNSNCVFSEIVNPKGR